MYARLVLVASAAAALVVGAVAQQPAEPPRLFRTADVCMACHNGLVTPSGEDVSIGVDWRASMMANSSRDPYWQAGVRRETMDHPESKAAIEHECSTCHMPMAHTEVRAAGGKMEVFRHLPVGAVATRPGLLAADGVSCTMCHQIGEEKLGTPESFTGGFVVDTRTPLGARSVFGPFPVDSGRVTVMHSASGFRQEQASHVQSSELCATCHTLYTHSLGPGGEVVGELPEQVPYLEWRHSAFREERSCQSCHMPVVEDSTAIASVMGQKRAGFSRHVFRGGNFFMLRMLNRYRDDLGVVALPQELDAAVTRTVRHLQTQAARVSLEGVAVSGGRLRAEVAVENLAGHKLPTAYPSRRAWIHFTVRDRAGRAVFESGALAPSGLIVGNDNDADPDRYEPHHREVTRPDQVQVYEPIMADPQGRVTTGLLTAVRYVKDNRILPRGFDKATAHADVAVQGGAARDPDFTGGGDRVVYSVSVAGAEGPFTVEAELWYQPIAFRWAQNLRPYAAPETQRFVSYYDSMAESSGVVLARAEAVARQAAAPQAAGPRLSSGR